MKTQKKKALEAKGFKVGTVDEFLTPHLEYYYECLETGRLKGRYTSWGSHWVNGLCHEEGIDKEILALFNPTEDELDEDLEDTGSDGWWGAGLPEDTEMSRLEGEFTPLRQNIVLLIACMKGEL